MFLHNVETMESMHNNILFTIDIVSCYWTYLISYKYISIYKDKYSSKSEKSLHLGDANVS